MKNSQNSIEKKKKKNKVLRFILPNFKTFDKSTVFKTV